MPKAEISPKEAASAVPLALVVELGKFALEKRTGNIQVNYRQGRVMGFRVEEIHNLP